MNISKVIFLISSVFSICYASEFKRDHESLLDAQLTTSTSAFTNAAPVEIVAAEAMYSEREGFIVTENPVFTAHTHMGIPVSFVLDRVTPQNRAFWNFFVKNQRDQLCRYSQTAAGRER